jgi:hypothetical protein
MEGTSTRLAGDHRHRRAGRRTLLVVLALAAAVRLAPVAWHHGDLARVSTADSVAYLELSRSLLERGTLVRFPPAAEARLGNPWPTEVFRTPGYPALLAAVTWAGGSALAVAVVQVLLDLVGVLLCAWIGARLFGTRVGLAAAALLAVDVGHAVYANMLMSDVPFALAVSASVGLVVRAVSPSRANEHVGRQHPGDGVGRGHVDLLLAGLASSVACAIRPLGALMGVPLAIYARWRGARRTGIGLLVAGSLAFPVGWVLRNYAENGVATLSNAYTFNLYLLGASKVKARAEGIAESTAYREVVAAAVAEVRARPPGEWDAALHAAGGWTFARYPAATVMEFSRGILEMAVGGERRMLLRLFGSSLGRDGPPGIDQGRRDLGSIVGYLGRAGVLEALMVLLQLFVNTAVAAAAVGGTWRLYRAGRSPEAFLIAALVAYFLLGSVTVASARMRLPVSFLVDLAAASLIAPWPVRRPSTGRDDGPTA